MLRLLLVDSEHDIRVSHPGAEGLPVAEKVQIPYGDEFHRGPRTVFAAVKKVALCRGL